MLRLLGDVYQTRKCDLKRMAQNSSLDINKTFQKKINQNIQKHKMQNKINTNKIIYQNI